MEKSGEQDESLIWQLQKRQQIQGSFSIILILKSSKSYVCYKNETKVENLGKVQYSKAQAFYMKMGVKQRMGEKSNMLAMEENEKSLKKDFNVQEF